MTLKRYFAVLSLIYIFGFMGFGLASCTNDAEMQGWMHKIDLNASAIEASVAVTKGLEAEVRAIDIDAPDAQDLMARLAAEIEKEGAKATRFLSVLKATVAEVEGAEDGFDVASALMGGAGSIFPPALLAIPFIRRAKAGYNAVKEQAQEFERHFDGLVASMAAGGGPRDPKLAKKHMLTIAGLKHRVTEQRIEIGNKVRKTTIEVAA